MQCPSCGNTVDPGAATCDACGNAMPQANVAPTATSQRGYGVQTQSFDCEGCGAQTVFSAQQMTLECPYCGSQKVIQLPPETQATTIQPEYVVPFKVVRETSGELFRAWVEGLWFAPGDLKQRAQADSIRGVYLPFWVYDVATMSHYRGEVGHHYFETKQVKDAQGNTRTEKEQKTRWSHGSGWHMGQYRDVLVCASKGVDGSLVRSIEPWNMADRQPYTAAFLAGWEAERYAFDSDAAWRDHGQERVRHEEQTACERKLQADKGADTTRGVAVDIRYKDLRSRHMLLPAYISAYRYKDQTYRFMINGQTGEVQGQRPYSWAKILLLVASIMAIIFAIAGGAALMNKPTPSPPPPSVVPGG
jgi:hypothetical protein